MGNHQIVMNFTLAPSLEDIEAIARSAFENLPDELQRFCDDLTVQVEDFPDSTIEVEQSLEDPFAMPILFRPGDEIAPGVVRKAATADDVLYLYRRPILDIWCELGEDLNVLIRQMIVEELAGHFDFTDDEIEEMAVRACQGL